MYHYKRTIMLIYFAKDIMEYGYCRTSTKKQNIERQVRNIKKEFPEAIIVKEMYTGAQIEGRKEFEKILLKVNPGDKIIFDSVSRMSRNAEEGFKTYEKLFKNGIELYFLKEPHINTSCYKKALDGQIKLTGTDADYILEGVNRYLLALAREQIKIAFNQAEKEVHDLRQRTREGIETARLEGKQIGRKNGTQIVTKKSAVAKSIIYTHNKSFCGNMNDKDTIDLLKGKLSKMSRNTFYKYKREMLSTESIYKEK